MHSNSAPIYQVPAVSAEMYLHAWQQRFYLCYPLLPANKDCRIASFCSFSLVICHSNLLLHLVLLFSWQDTEQSVFRQIRFLSYRYRCRDRCFQVILHIVASFPWQQKVLRLPWKPACNPCVRGIDQQMKPHRWHSQKNRYWQVCRWLFQSHSRLLHLYQRIWNAHLTYRPFPHQLISHFHRKFWILHCLFFLPVIIFPQQSTFQEMR